MMKLVLACLLCAATLVSGPAEVMAADDGFTPLLDAFNTSGWRHFGEGEMRVVGGIATTFTPAGTAKGGMYLYEKQRFTDFAVRLEFRVDAVGANSGVLLRVGDPSSGYDEALAQGYEVDIYGPKTGTIVALPNRLRPTHPVEIVPGTWNELEAQVTGQHYVVRLNGQTINDFSGNRAAGGFVALQNYSGAGQTSFRNVRIRQLSTSEASGPAGDKAVIDKAGEKTAVDELARQGPNAIEWALAPLDEAVPADIRQNLTFLREDLLDEAQKAPKASAAAYTAGAELCSAVLGRT